MAREPLIRPKREASFFIGWSPDVPVIDRRAMLASALGLVALGGAGGAGLAALQNAPGLGGWSQTLKDWPGLVAADPYPLLRTFIDGAPATALLVCATKCGVRPRLEGLAGGPVILRASLLARGRHKMLAVADGPDWVRPAGPGVAVDAAALAPPAPEPLGEAALHGEILDAKCWFGAMRPGWGKKHKSCAALCLRSGIPPAFFTRDAAGGSHAVVMTDADGGPLDPEAAARYAADPLRAEGALVRLGDLLTFRSRPEAWRRL